MNGNQPKSGGRKSWYERVRSRGTLLSLPLNLLDAAWRRQVRFLSELRLRTLCGVKLGKRCYIGQGIQLVYPNRISIGDRAVIGRRVRLWCEMPTGWLDVHDGVDVGRDTVLDFSGGLTIGRGTLISEEVLIYTHDHGYDPRSEPTASPLTIGEHSWIGARAIILPRVRSIGANAIIGAGAVVTCDVPDNHIYVASEGRILAKRKDRSADASSALSPEISSTQQ